MTAIPDNPLALVLCSLAGGQSLPAKTTEQVLIGVGLPTIPKALLKKIQWWEIIDLVDVLPAFLLMMLWQTVPPRHISPYFQRGVKHYPEYVEWPFTVYTAAIVQKFPAAVNELLAY